jgi:hypothetical protein
MTRLTQLFSSINFEEPAIWIALGAAFSVVLAFLLLGRRQRRALAIIAPAPTTENAFESADLWAAASVRPDERRRSIRRGGVPTAIQITDPLKPKKSIEGFVLDRSIGGIRLASEQPFASGTSLNVRAMSAPADLPSVLIIVRSCREVGDYFELGCQFQEDLPWHLLLLFG